MITISLANVHHYSQYNFSFWWDLLRSLFDGSVVKNPPVNAGDARDAGSISGSGKSPKKGNGNPLQYSCLKNSMERGAWWATVHAISKSQTWLNMHACIQKKIWIIKGKLISRSYVRALKWITESECIHPINTPCCLLTIWLMSYL